MILIRSLLLAGAAFVFTLGCDTDSGDTATETNVVPVPCDSDEDCLGLRCIFYDAGVADAGHMGECEVVLP